MRSLGIGDKTYQIPGHVNECSPEQMAVYMEVVWLVRDLLFVEDNDGNIGWSQKYIGRKDQIDIALAYALLMHDLSWSDFNKLGVRTVNDIVNEAKIQDIFYNSNLLTDCVLQHVRIRKKTFYGPSSNFQSLTFEEWSFTELFFSHYMNSKEEKFLNLLCAVLFRPEKKDYNPESPEYDGDRREEFNEHTIKVREKLFKAVPLNQKAIVAFWYLSCSLELWKRNPNIPKGGSKKTMTPVMAREMILNISGGKFGNFNQTKKQNVHWVMAELNRQSKNTGKNAA